MSSSQTLDSTPPPASPSPKKRGRKKAGEGTPTPTPEKKPPEKTATPLDRPSRERKTVERYSASAPRRASASKVAPIKEGSGTKLKDIPNVTFKLSKRKPDERLQNLHKVLFGKRCKAHYLKRNIMQFSGFVWTDDEEKQKARLTEKLSKFVKDDLLDFCDVLDVSIGSKTSTKKVDVMTLLLAFLESPHVTRDLILEDKQKSAKKRKRTKNTSETTSAKKQRRQKLDKTEGEDNQEEPVDEDEEKEEVDAEDESASDDDDDDQEKSEAEEEEKEEPLKEPKVSAGKKKKGAKSMDIEDDKPARKSTPVKSAKGEGTPRKNAKHISTTPQKAPMKNCAKGGSANKVELTSRAEVKSKNEKSKMTKNKDSVPKDKKSNQKQVSKTKSSSKPSNKEKDKGKGVKKASVSPTKEELYAVVTDILKVVDFNTATLADILKQLGTHFGTDLMSRKTEVKGIIEDVISNMSDDDESEEEGDEKEAEEDGKEAQQDDQEEAPQEKADTEKESEKVEDVTESSDKDGEGKKGEDDSP